MGRTIKIRVPGTSANCGPGFDCLGVSCTIYNDMELTLLQEPELQIFVEGEGATYEFTGTITLVGIVENAFDYTLNEGTKLSNYDITNILY